MAVSTRIPHVLALSLAWVISIVSIGAGINSFVKSNDKIDNTKRLASSLPGQSGLQLDISIHDIVSVGAVLLAGLILLAISTTLFIPLSILKKGPHRFETAVLGFLAFWIFVCDIANTVISRNHDAKVRAVLNGTVLPDATIKGFQRILGISTSYWVNNYVRFYAIVPWFAFIAAAFATLTALLGAKERRETKA